MRALPMAVAGAALLAIATAPAHAVMFQGSFSVDSYGPPSENGLDIRTRAFVDGINDNGDLDFDLDVGESTGYFELFKIWTPESFLNPDDFNPQPIEVDFSFDAPPPSFGGSGNGTTAAGTIVIASGGIVTWSNPTTINFGPNADGVLNVDLTGGIFNPGPGFSFTPGEAHALTVKAKFTLKEAASDVPEPATLAVLGLGLLGLGFATRRRRNAV